MKSGIRVGLTRYWSQPPVPHQLEHQYVGRGKCADRQLDPADATRHVYGTRVETPKPAGYPGTAGRVITRWDPRGGNLTAMSVSSEEYVERQSAEPVETVGAVTQHDAKGLAVQLGRGRLERVARGSSDQTAATGWTKKSRTPGERFVARSPDSRTRAQLKAVRLRSRKPREMNYPARPPAGGIRRSPRIPTVLLQPRGRPGGRASRTALLEERLQQAPPDRVADATTVTP